MTSIRAASTRIGFAYFGVRDPDVFGRDLAEMAAMGCTWVLLPFTHDDAMWERSTFRLLVDRAEAEGLESVISLWGGDDFGGEGVQSRMTTHEWLARAKATGARSFHIDEPRVTSVYLPRLLDEWGDDASAWLTVKPDRTAGIDRETVRRVAVLGTDAYDGDLDERVQVTSAFGDRVGRLDLAWVQAFRIRSGAEAFVGDVVRAMAGVAPVVGIWGWKGSTGRGELRSDRPDVVQQHVRQAIAAVRSARTGARNLPGTTVAA